MHLADFPRDVDAWADAGLEERWGRLLEIRGTVNAALEIARAEKTIGSALTAHVTLIGVAGGLLLLMPIGVYFAMKEPRT